LSRYTCARAGGAHLQTPPHSAGRACSECPVTHHDRGHSLSLACVSRSSTHSLCGCRARCTPRAAGAGAGTAALAGRAARAAGACAPISVLKQAAPPAHATRTALVSHCGSSATAESQWACAGAGGTAGQCRARWRCGGMRTAPRHQGSPAACAQRSSSTGWVVDRAKLSTRCKQGHAVGGCAQRSGGRGGGECGVGAQRAHSGAQHSTAQRIAAQHSTGWMVDRAKLSTRCWQQHVARGRWVRTAQRWMRSGKRAVVAVRSGVCATAAARVTQGRARPWCAGLAYEPIRGFPENRILLFVEKTTFREIRCCGALLSACAGRSGPPFSI
jgi:hypothetical protein